MAQIGIRHLLIVTALAAIGLAVLAGETISVALGSVLSIACFLGAGVLGWVSLSDLGNRFRTSFQHRTLRPLIARIKWLVPDLVWMLLMVAGIATANRVFEENSGPGARVLIIAAIVIAPVFGIWVSRKLSSELRRRKKETGTTAR